MNSMALWYWNRGEKAHAKAASAKIADESLRAEWEALFRQEEFSAVLATKDTDYILAYLDTHEDIPERDGFLAEYHRKKYDEILEAGNYPEAFRLAAAYGYDTADLVNDPAIVREALDEAYFLQTPSQMRLYHAETVSAADMIVSVQNGKVSWVEGGAVLSVTNAVSVSASEYVTSILLSDGSVRVYANRSAGNSLTAPASFEADFIAASTRLSNIVAMSSGERHTAYLRADGTVMANSQGVCNFNTSGNKTITFKAKDADNDTASADDEDAGMEGTYKYTTGKDDKGDYFEMEVTGGVKMKFYKK